jgi:CspA family cold shock protein
MATGVIKRINVDKGFGFIRPDERSFDGDLFFHRSALQDVQFEALHEGDAVEFELGTSPKGPRAESVRVA